jgi:hypothetical protein
MYHFWYMNTAFLRAPRGSHKTNVQEFGGCRVVGESPPDPRITTSTSATGAILDQSVATLGNLLAALLPCACVEMSLTVL